MSRATDTAARVLANLDGETKSESLGAEEALEVFALVGEELARRHERLAPTVDAMRAAREDLSAQDRASNEGLPQAPRPTSTESFPIESGPHGVPGVPVNAQSENTPATHVDRAPISAGGAAGTNDLGE